MSKSLSDIKKIKEFYCHHCPYPFNICSTGKTISKKGRLNVARNTPKPKDIEKCEYWKGKCTHPKFPLIKE